MHSGFLNQCEPLGVVHFCVVISGNYLCTHEVLSHFIEHAVQTFKETIFDCPGIIKIDFPVVVITLDLNSNL